MTDLSLDGIFKYLEEKNLAPQKQAETQQVFIVLKVMEREFPLFFRIFEDTRMLQMILFVPAALKESAIPDTGRLLHLLNKELDIPGFGMDEQSKIVFYRIMVPAPDAQINDELLNAYLNSVKNVAEVFSPIVAAVSSGNASFKEIVAKLEQMRKKS